MLDRKAILGFKDKRVEKVDLPELGGEVCVGSLTVTEMDKLTSLDGSTPASVEVVILGACDESSKRLFTEKDREDLAGLPASVVGKLAEAVLKFNGLGKSAGEQAKND